MLGLIANLFLMGILLFGVMKAYADIPFLNENPIFSSVGGIMVLVILLWIFPKLIGLVIKFVAFCCVVFFICQATGIDFTTFTKKTTSAIEKKTDEIAGTVSDISDTVSSVQNAAEAVQNITTPAQVITAKVSAVQTGHTMTIDNEEVQLYGIDTPDLAQSCKTTNGMNYQCGAQSRTELSALTQGKDVKCELKGKSRAGKRFATCQVDGDDVAALMVRNGWAVADKTQTDKYTEEEKSAYMRKMGMWNGKFQAPWTWREKNGVAKTESAENTDSKPSPFQKIMGFFGK